MTQCDRVCACPKMLARQKVRLGRHREAANMLVGNRGKIWVMCCQGMGHLSGTFPHSIWKQKRSCERWLTTSCLKIEKTDTRSRDITGSETSSASPATASLEAKLLLYQCYPHFLAPSPDQPWKGCWWGLAGGSVSVILLSFSSQSESFPRTAQASFLLVITVSMYVGSLVGN